MMARRRIAWCFVSLVVVASVVLGAAATADARPAQENEDDEPYVAEPSTPEEGGDCFVLTNVYVAFDPQSEPPDAIEPGTEDQVGTVEDWEDYTRDPSWTENIPDTDMLYCLRNGAYRLLGRVSDRNLGRPVDPSSLPTEGTCLVVLDPPRLDGELALLGEVTPPAHPSDYYENVVTFDEYREIEEADQLPLGIDLGIIEGGPLEAGQIFCAMGGIWRRADLLRDGCGGRSYEGVPRTGSVASRCWGSFPTANYNITYDPGEWDEFDRKLYGFFTGLFFDVGKNVTALGLWAVDWAYDFDVGEFVGFVRVIGDDYQDNLIVPFGIEGIVFFLLVGWVAIALLRGKVAQAAGEIAVALVLMALAGVLLANRLDYLNSIGDVMEKGSADLLVAGTGGDPEESQGELTLALHQAEASLHRSLVEQPYDYLNWGRLLDGTPCEEARNEVLGWGLSSTDPKVREWMQSMPEPNGACQPEADFNAKPTPTRLISSLLTMLVDFAAVGFLGGTALTVVASKFAALLLLAMAPFAAALAGAPAGARRLPWLWVTSTGQTVVTVIVSSFMLSLFMLSLKAILGAMGDRPPEERTAIVLILALVLGAVRRRSNKSVESSTGRLADNLTNWRPGGGGAPWQGPSGTQGMALSGLEDYARTGIGRASMVAGGAAGGMAASGLMGAARLPFRTVGGVRRGLVRMASNSWGRYRTRKGGLKNLRTMERYREMAGHESGTPMSFKAVGSIKRVPGYGRKWPGNPMPRGRRTGGGPIPRGPGGGGGGPGGPMPHGPGGGPHGGGGPGGPHGGGGPGGSPMPGPGGAASPGTTSPSGGWAKTKWELAKDTLHLDRGAEMFSHGAKSFGRGWDKATAAMGAGAKRVTGSTGHPGGGGRPLRPSTMKDRWAEREAARPTVRQGDWRGKRAKARQEVDRIYQDRRAAERTVAEGLGQGRRRLTPDERRQHLHQTESPSQARRKDHRQINEQYAHPEAKEIRFSMPFRKPKGP